MANTTVKSGTKNVINSGVVLHGGTIVSGMTNHALLTNSHGPKNLVPTVPSPYNGMGYAITSAAVAITAVTQSGSTGYVNIEKTTHGLAVGDIIMVSGTNVVGYNVTHKVTVVTDANNIQTDVFYSADSTTHGYYRTVSGSYNKMVAGRYISRFLSGGYLANVANTSMEFSSAQRFRRHIDGANNAYRYDITSWDYVTGVVTKGSNAGASYNFVDPVGGGTADDSAIRPTMAIPGEFTYLVTGQVPTNVDFEAKYSY